MIDIQSPARATMPAPRNTWEAIGRGARLRCPACGECRMFHRYLKVNDACPNCGQELHHHRADDAPPYMTIFAVGHIIVPLLLYVERGWSPPDWVHAALWMPLTLVLTLSILPVMKGALIALQWALRMHGFNEAADPEFPVEPASNSAKPRP